MKEENNTTDVPIAKKQKIEQDVEWFVYDKESLKENTLSDTITHLKFTGQFDQPLTKNMLPTNLTHLIFEGKFNRAIRSGVLPESLKELTFNQLYNHLIVSEALPPNLAKLTVHKDYELRMDVMKDLIQNYSYKMTLSFSDDNVSISFV